MKVWKITISLAILTIFLMTLQGFQDLGALPPSIWTLLACVVISFPIGYLLGEGLVGK